MESSKAKTPKRLWGIISLLTLITIASALGFGVSINGVPEKVFTPIVSLIIALGLYFRLGVFRFLIVFISLLFVLVSLALVAFTIDIVLKMPSINWLMLLGVAAQSVLALLFLWIISYLTSQETKELFGKKTGSTSGFARKALFGFIALFSVALFILTATNSFMPLTSKMMTAFTPMGDDESKIDIAKTPRTFVKDEAVVYDMTKLLPVKGTDTSLCFLVGRGAGQDSENVIKAVLGDAYDQKVLIEGKVTSSEGKTYPLSSRLSQAWSMSTFSMDSGDVSLCAQVKFSEECCGVMEKSEREKKVEIPSEIKKIEFKLLADVKAISVYWTTSDSNESMRDVWKNAAEEDKQSPFYPRSLYEELLKVFSGTSEHGKIVFETQSIKFHSNENYQAMRNAEDSNAVWMDQIKKGILNDEEVTGVQISLSDEGLHIIPKDPVQAKDQSIKIDNKFIHSCSARCFGKNIPWDAIFVISEPAYTLEVKDGVEFIEWCWKNRIPVLSRKHRSAWYYESTPLPVLDDESQFTSLEEYKKRINKVCAGY